MSTWLPPLGQYMPGPSAIQLDLEDVMAGPLLLPCPSLHAHAQYPDHPGAPRLPLPHVAHLDPARPDALPRPGSPPAVPVPPRGSSWAPGASPGPGCGPAVGSYAYTVPAFATSPHRDTTSPSSIPLAGASRFGGPGVHVPAPTSSALAAADTANTANVSSPVSFAPPPPPPPPFHHRAAHIAFPPLATLAAVPCSHFPELFCPSLADPLHQHHCPPPLTNADHSFVSAATANYDNLHLLPPSPLFHDFGRASLHPQAPYPLLDILNLPTQLDTIQDEHEHEHEHGHHRRDDRDSSPVADRQGERGVDEAIAEDDDDPRWGVSAVVSDSNPPDEDPKDENEDEESPQSAALSALDCNQSMPSATDGGSRRRGRVVSIDDVAGSSRQKRRRSQSTVSVASRAGARVRKTSRQTPVVLLGSDDLFIIEDEDDKKMDMVDMTADDNIPAELKGPPDERISTKLGTFECVICLDTASTLTVTHCGHMFCGACLHQAMHAEVTKKICPMCRQKLDDRHRNAPVRNSAKTFFHLELKLELTKSQGKQPVRPVIRR